MKRLAVSLVVGACVLTGCAEAAPTAAHGAAALGPRPTTMDELAALIRDSVGECADLTPRRPGDLAAFVGPDMAARYEPYVTEWATCRVSAMFPKVGLLLFAGDAQREFQESWRAAMAGGELADGPSFAFGNGFAVSAGILGVHDLGLYYFRCDYDDPLVHKIRADVEGCVFANPEHGHH